MRQTTFDHEPPAPTLHLIDDDDLPTGRGGPRARVRVWAARGRVSVVLVSREETDLPWPAGLSTRAADYAYGPLLGFPATGMHFFERDGGMFFRTTFGLVGGSCYHRIRHADVRRRATTRREIENLIGRPIEV